LNKIGQVKHPDLRAGQTVAGVKDSVNLRSKEAKMCLTAGGAGEKN
jgi:hypothetical protein